MSIVAVSLVFVLQGAQVPAAPFKLPRTDFRVPAYPGANLLSWQVVQRDIRFSETAAKTLQLSIQAQNAMISTTRPTSWDPKRDKFRPALANALSVLSPTQKKRLGEIYIQRLDVSSLVDPYVAKQVGLSEVQRKFVGQRLTAAHHQHLDAQEKMFYQFQKDGLEIQKSRPVQPAIPGRISKPSRTSYSVPRHISIAQTDLTRKVRLLGMVEMTKARAEIRSKLTPQQLAKLQNLKGRPLAATFYEPWASFGEAQPHPDLLNRMEVQAELGMSLKDYMRFSEDRKLFRNDPVVLEKYLSRLTAKQRAQLHGYELQYDGEFSILRHDVAQAIGLDQGTIDQVGVKIETLAVEGHRKADLIWLRYDKNENDQQVSKLRQKTLSYYDQLERKAIVDSLTSAQKTKWLRLLGKPLKDIRTTHSYG